MTDTVPVHVYVGRDDIGGPSRGATEGTDPDASDGTVLDAPVGAVLRDVLLEHGITPHGRYATRLNCGGRGLCATCGVRVLTADGDVDPSHWHDRLADRFGYPRLSCQIRVEAPLTVLVLPEKRVWGRRERD